MTYETIGTDWVRVARFWKPGDTVSLNVDRYARRVGDSVAVVEVYLGQYAATATLPIRKFLRRFRVEPGPVPLFYLQRLDEAIEKAVAYARSR